MQNLVKQLSTYSDANAGAPLNSKEIIFYQKELYENQIATIPADYLIFLHSFNAFLYNGSALYGLSPVGDFFLDILGENIYADHPNSSNIILLGHSELDYLAYNNAEFCYQIIDKSDFMVLKTYQSCNDAIKHILKIANDQYF